MRRRDFLRLSTIPLLAQTSHTVIVFPSKALADTILREIAVTPSIEGSQPIWVWKEPEEDQNTVSYGISSDGRVAIAHAWDEATRDWLEEYLKDWPTVQVLDALPSNWRHPLVNE